MRRRSSTWPHRASSRRATSSGLRSGRSCHDASCGIPPRVFVCLGEGNRVNGSQAHLAGSAIQHEPEDPRLHSAAAHFEIEPVAIVVHPLPGNALDPTAESLLDTRAMICMERWSRSRSQ
jgi:hypothetical protein